MGEWLKQSSYSFVFPVFHSFVARPIFSCSASLAFPEQALSFLIISCAQKL